MFRRCVNPACDRSFHLSRFRAGISQEARTGEIVCPYCGFKTKDDAGSVFLAYALSPDEERQAPSQSELPQIPSE